MRIALLNQSSVSADDMATIGQALNVYLTYVADAWERRPPQVEFMKGVTIAPDDAIPLLSVDDPDVSGALGYHDCDPKGRPYGRAFFKMIPSGIVLRDRRGGGESLAGCLSHEAAEIFGDPFVNLYSDGPIHDPATQAPHAMVAVELGDPVQAQAFAISVNGTEVDASNFVLPAWFSHRASGQPVDHMRQLQVPLTIAPGGYAIVRDVVSDTEIFGRFFKRPRVRVSKLFHHLERPAAWREAIKDLPGGRTARRFKNAGH